MHRKRGEGGFEQWQVWLLTAKCVNVNATDFTWLEYLTNTKEKGNIVAKSKYIELSFADGPNSPKHSVAGYLIVSDLAGGGNRNLVLKNMNGVVARKPRAKRGKPKAGAAGEATAFPGSAAANG